jgi:hypothetical protein
MVWILKGFLLLAKSRRGRRLLFGTALIVADLARHERAQKLYARVRRGI